MDYVWDSSLETGNELIDSQHKALFIAVNNLLEICRKGKGKEEVSKSLDFLTQYTIKHFFDEEQLQQKYKYPDFPIHKKYHDDFKVTVRDLSHELIMKGATDRLIEELKNKIGGWLVTHIKGQDAKVAAHIRNQIAAQK
ncbi:MAG: hemerythrin family protein [Treponema sp.]|jgi:hemerythrin|nr:hemerythrin family protein [Treponema sp.]